MDNPTLLGKRKKKKKSGCTNPLFLKWLTEWRNEANEKGWKSAFNYSKVSETQINIQHSTISFICVVRLC
jgi:hypothetical protein